jgi:hypothetical protein
VAVALAVGVAIGVWLDVYISQELMMTDLANQLTLSPILLVVPGLIGALTAVGRPQLAAISMLVAATGSVVVGATDILSVGFPAGFRGVGGVLILGAALWMSGAFMAFRASREPPAGK